MASRDVEHVALLGLDDAVSALSFLFLGGGSPPCLDAADTNDSGEVDISDAIATLAFLFLGGTAPPPPGTTDCGGDPTPDEIGCDDYPVCR